MLTLKIVSPENIVYDGEVSSVKVPGILGNFEILQNHAPLISALQVGTVAYTNKDGEEKSGFQFKFAFEFPERKKKGE